MSVPVFTVTRKTKVKQDAIGKQRYVLTISTLPGRSWTHGFREMSDELYVSALISRVEARNLILDAWATGSASVTGNCSEPDTAEGNCAYVRNLLHERQSAFAAALEAVTTDLAGAVS